MSIHSVFFSLRGLPEEEAPALVDALTRLTEVRDPQAMEGYLRRASSSLNEQALRVTPGGSCGIAGVSYFRGLGGDNLREVRWQDLLSLSVNSE